MIHLLSSHDGKHFGELLIDDPKRWVLASQEWAEEGYNTTSRVRTISKTEHDALITSDDAT